MTMPNQVALPGDNQTTEELLSELLSCFHQQEYPDQPTSEKPMKKKKKVEVQFTDKKSSKTWKTMDQQDTVLSADLIAELKQLREQQRTSSQTARYVSVAKSK